MAFRFRCYNFPGPAGDSIAHAEARISRQHVLSLDGLRGLAFLLVFFRHYAQTTHAKQMWLKVVALISVGGWMGVDLFFVLSGFLITGILLDTREHPRYFKNFYARRALRIFPLYYTVLAVLLVLTPWLHLQWHTGHLAYLIYAGNLASNLNPNLEQVLPAVSFLHLWSLAVEEQFYLIWPLLVLAVANRLLWVCCGLSLAGLLLRIGFLMWLPHDAAYEWCYSELPTHMDGLLYGALAAIFVRTQPLELTLRRARKVLPWMVGVVVTVVWFGGPDFHNVPMIVIGFPALAATFACMVLLALRPGSLVNRVGNLRALRFVGRYSYGMYLYHILFWPGLAWMQNWFQVRLHSVALGGVCFTVLMLSGTMVLAIASYELYEKKWLTLKTRLSYDETPTELAA